MKHTGMFIIISLVVFAACDEQVSNKPPAAILPIKNIIDTAAPLVLAPGEKMDTLHFWKIMDYAFEVGGFNNAIKEQAILNQLTRLTPAQIVDFEIIFQQMNLKAATWNNIAAQVILDYGATDDGSYYFRCWLISLGEYNFEKTLENPDHLASLPIPVKENGLCEVWFEELIPMADIAYSIVTKNNEPDSTTCPRCVAMQKGLFYDSGLEMKGKEWRTKEELIQIVPLLCKKYRR